MNDVLINPQTGQALQLANGKWAPVDQARVMTNPQTGEVAVYDGAEWTIAGRVGPTADAANATEPTPEQRQADYLNRDTLVPRLELYPNAVRDFEAPVDNWATTMRGVGHSYADAALLGGADELVSGVKGTFSADPWRTFDDTMGRLEIEGGQFAAEHPNLKTGAEIAGIVGSPLNVAGGELIAGGRPALGQAGRGAFAGSTMGGAGGFLSTEGDLSDRFRGAGIGAGIGAATGGALPIVGAAIAPRVRPEVQALIDRGVTPTPGQILGGAAARTEEKLASMPVVGDFIAGGQRRAIDDFNRAVYNETLAPIGATLPRNQEVGRVGIAAVEDTISQRYGELLPRVTFNVDQQLAGEVANLRSLASQMPPREAERFNQILVDKVGTRLAPTGTMDGLTYKRLESELGKLASGYRRSADPDQHELGDAILELQRGMRSSLARTNPDMAPELQAANEAWSRFIRLQRAGGATGSDAGVFTPAHFQNAVKASDNSVRKGAFARGDALMQDLSDAGKSVLGQKYPNSGTPGRLALLASGAGLGFIEPTTLALTGAMTLPYTSPGQRLAAALLTRRPQSVASARSLVNALRMPAAIGSGAAGGAIATPGNPAVGRGLPLLAR
jgi:hypothetical protein